MLTDRAVLFRGQMIAGLFAFALMMFELYMPVRNVLKLVIAPFGAISLILFLLFVFNQVIRDFHNNPYTQPEIVKSLLLLTAAAVGICVLVPLLKVNTGFDKTLFFVSLLMGVFVFLYLRVGNLWSMAVVTGTIEGIIIYLVFV